MKRNIIFTIIALLATIHLMADNQRLVGTIDVNATVSESGGAVVSIPIDIPAGINGMQPNLALVYNSQGGLGIAGWGWDLSGLSSISRTGSTFYHDGKTDGIKFTTEDHLLLDGQRLVLNSGSYWGANSMYRTEIETFKRATYYSSGTYFKVQAKDGTISTYGDSDSTRLAYGSNYILSWLIREAKDPNNNYIRYFYNRTSTDNLQETALDSIVYAGNGSGSHVYTIFFEYQTLLHPHSSVMETVVAPKQTITFTQSKLLTKINVRKANGQSLYSYLLSYDNTSGMEPRLNYVQKVAVNGDYYVSNVITWNSPNEGSDKTATVSLSRKTKFLHSDFTGDGKTDILSYSEGNASAVLYKNTSSNGNVSFAPISIELSHGFNSLTPLDFNGDGRMDLAGVYMADYATFKVQCFLSTGDGFSSTGDVGNPMIVQHKIVTGDFDGDGMDEIFLPFDATVYDYLDGSISTIGAPFDLSLYHLAAKNHLFQALDFNGNGKTDIFVATQDSVFAYEITPSFTFEKIKKASRTSLSVFLDIAEDKFLFGDFNGDGRTDFIYYGYDSNPNDGMFEANLCESTATGFVWKRTNKFPSVPTYISAADCNGDGLLDFLYTFGSSSVGYRVSLNTGDSFQTLSHTWDSMAPADIVGNNGIAFTDFTGDGLADLFCFKNGANNAVIRPIYTGSHHLVSSVQDGFGNVHQFTYKPLADSNVYTVSNTPPATFPYNVFRQPMNVVSSLTAPYENKTFTYKDAIVHKQGKGFLGFMQMTVQDNLNNVKTISSKKISENSNYAYLIPTQSVSKTLNNEVISTSVFSDTLIVYNAAKKHIWPSVVKTVTTDHLTTLGSTEWNKFDSYGNVLKSTVIHGALKTEQSFVVGNIASWCSNKIIYQSEKRTLNGVSSDQRTRNYTYNSTTGNLTKLIEDNSSTLKLTHNYTYDTFGNVTQETMTGSGQTRTRKTWWSDNGCFSTKTRDELGQETTYVYSDDGFLQKKTTAEGETTYTYDKFGRLLTTTTPDGVVKSTTSGFVTGYNGIKFYVTETTTRQPIVTTYYNAVGKPLYEMKTDFNNLLFFKAYGYKNNGKLEYVSEPFIASSLSAAMGRTYTSNNATMYSYDDYWRIESVRSPKDNITYHYNGLSTTVTNKEIVAVTQKDNTGMVVTRRMTEKLTLTPDTIPNPLYLLRSIPEPDIESRAIHFEYYPTGLVKTITPDGSSTITLDYDLHGNRISLADLDAGTISDTYNAFGQLTKHVQPLHNGTVETNYSYHSTKGQLVSETTNGVTKTYDYDTTFPELPAQITRSGNTIAYSYDIHGRLTQVQRTIGSETVTDSYTYYAFGKVSSHDHNGHATEHFTYDSYGNLVSETLDSSNTPLWELLEVNARGQVVQERKSGITTTYSYDTAGRVTSIVAPNIINLQYTYDEAGNTTSKYDGIYSIGAHYEYDGFNRLTKWNVERPFLFPNTLTSPMAVAPSYPFVSATDSMSYDRFTGNILTKSDLGANAAFAYGNTSKPHALTGVSNVSSSWGTNDMTIAYTDFGKVQGITQTGATYSIGYLPDDNRGKTILTKGNRTITRYYGDGTEKVSDSFGALRDLSYLRSGAIVVVDEIAPSDTVDRLSYSSNEMENVFSGMEFQTGEGFLSASVEPKSQPVYSTTVLQGYYDAQGSLVALVTTSGTVARRFAYDPWGKRMDPTDWTLPDTRNDSLHINRGYTMHEHLGDFGLINMNGRVFDPATAQFLSTDNYIQDLNNWLNYNRYSYGYNNPLKYTDPSGESFLLTALIAFAIGALADYALQVANNMNKFDIEFKTALTYNINVWEIVGVGALGVVSVGLVELGVLSGISFSVNPSIIKHSVSLIAMPFINKLNHKDKEDSDKSWKPDTGKPKTDEEESVWKKTVYGPSNNNY